MSFDALTISGILAALVSGAVMFGVAHEQGGRWRQAPRRPALQDLDGPADGPGK